MTVEQYESIETVTLGGADLDLAIELLADRLDEIPLYSWLLGEHIADRSLRKWLAEILVRPLLNAGYVIGARRGDRLVGLLVFQPHDADLSVGGKPPLAPADFAAVATVPGMRERVADLLTGSKLPPPADDAINLRIGVVAHTERGGLATVAMMRELERFCAAAARPFYAWTGSETLRRYYTEVWGATEFSSENWNGITMYGLVSDGAPRSRRAL
ncbi:hypothetical protein [Gordonia metallireducens]|uniref:hypothetical protein n=1 Tax=Gordonia metallireducens TaxID=2897779 RepID=UPI001E3EFF60|nr:hypothetical protein [Gordonia metallireducens]